VNYSVFTGHAEIPDENVSDAVVSDPDRKPIAVLNPPVMLWFSAPTPMAVL
jgi:hypothetical protein